MTDQVPPRQDDEPEENEVLRAARERRQQQEAADAAEAADKEAAKGHGKRGWKTAAAAGLGIGSAAVIAALLYANRDKIK
jgi:hypothetical protein